MNGPPYVPARIFETMKMTSMSARIASVVALLAALPSLAQAHPGHSAFDWFTYGPHAGHESEYAVVFNVIAILLLAGGIYALGSRKR